MNVVADTIDDEASEMGIALSDIYPDSTYGAGLVIDQQDSLEAYLAFDDGALAEAPQALAAYVEYQQNFAL